MNRISKRMPWTKPKKSKAWREAEAKKKAEKERDAKKKAKAKASAEYRPFFNSTSVH